MKRRDALNIAAVSGVAAALGGGLVRELIRAGRLHRTRQTRKQMGTLVTMTIVHENASAGRAMLLNAFDEIERLENLLSRHRPETPVAKLNRSGIVLNAPSELIEVIAMSLEMSRRTNGAFDITIAPLLDLYRSRFASGQKMPDDAEINQSLELTGYERLRVEGSSVRLDAPGMGITLDGVAKGYIVDRTVELMRKSGADRVMVDAGGDIATVASEDDPWSIALQDPHDNKRTIGSVRLAGRGCATSGDYLNAFVADRSAHHIIDPRTGRSPVSTSSVSVVADSLMMADAASTGVMVMGASHGLAFLENAPGVEGIIVAKGGERHASSGFMKIT